MNNAGINRTASAETIPRKQSFTRGLVLVVSIGVEGRIPMTLNANWQSYEAPPLMVTTGDEPEPAALIELVDLNPTLGLRAIH